MNHCLYCHKEIAQQMTWLTLMSKNHRAGLCHECEAQLEEIQGETCEVCSRPLANLDEQFVVDGVCHDCQRWEQGEKFKGTLDKNISIYMYNDFLKELISRYKYRGDYVLAQIFSKKLKQKVESLVSFSAQPQFVPIPLSNEREWERGFNQSEALIVAAGFTPARLLARIHGEKQSKKSRIERIHLPQVFQLAEKITGETIILFDDIYTTGSTLRHAAKILKENGAKTVMSLTIAR